MVDSKTMIHRLIVALVLWCWRHWRLVSVAAILATLGMGWYAAGTLGIDTDESKLLSSHLPFRKAERAMNQAFPGHDGLVVVVNGPSAAQADIAADRLLAKLKPQTRLFKAVALPPGTDFFQREGLLYLPQAKLQTLSEQLTRVQPMLGTLFRDPSLRGVMTALDLMTQGVSRHAMQATDLTPALDRFTRTADSVLAGHPQPVKWSDLLGPAMPSRAPRALILAEPRLDYSDITPGAHATAAIRTAAIQLGLTPAHGYSVRLTGSVALTDANFTSVTQGIWITGVVSIVSVVLLLFLAVRSKRMVWVILATLVTGLAATGAFAAVTVKTLNPISVAFAVMFVGIAVDFAIQFTVRYREALIQYPDPTTAMAACARKIAAPLTLAAMSSAAGFLSFLPTDYVGVSQLGLVAGGGMVIALIVDFTLLPALLHLARPPARREVVGMPFARPLDRFIAHYPAQVVGAAVILGIVGLALLPRLHFDFNPLDLQNPKAEAVRTMRALSADPETSPYSIDLIEPDLAAADTIARKLNALPEVSHTATLADFVPDHQQAKLAVISDLAAIYGPVTSAALRLPPPTPAQNVAALTRTAARLRTLDPDPGGAAHRLADLLDRVAAAGPDKVAALSTALLGGLPDDLTELARLMNAQPVTRANLPPSLVRHWLTPDGRARITVWPKADMNDQNAMRRFVAAVQHLAPDASGMPVSVIAAGGAVVNSFIQAGTAAIIAIALLLGLMLRRLTDALLVMAPLLLGGLYTVIGCVALGLNINFANIIALPLLLGIGVAFNIYFVVNWRNGVRNHLHTSTGRAVLFSALTTASAFGSLALSPHVGTASMGLLLFLSVALSVATTFLVLPAILHLMPQRPHSPHPAHPPH